MRKVLLLLFLFPCAAAYGQEDSLPLSISISNEATAIPFTRIPVNPVHPGVQLGTEFVWRESSRFRLYPAVNLGYMYHRNLFQGMYLNTELGFDYKFRFGLNLKSALGIGYLRTYATRQEYQFENGRYKKGRDRGNSRLMPSLSLGAGYRFEPDNHRSPELFILYQNWLEYPYSPGFIPLMAHINIHLGAKFYPFNNK